jgi:hypothetical protein
MTEKLNLDKLDTQIIQEMMEMPIFLMPIWVKNYLFQAGTIHVRIKKLEELMV